MTTFTETWDASFEASPPDTQQIKQGAARIRELKLDIRERLEVDHSMDGDANDGAHKKVTLLEQGSAPTNVANTAFLYALDNGSGVTKVYVMDSAGVTDELGGFPSGTRMAFAQAAAPTGWTQYNTLTNYMMRVVNNTVSGAYATSWEVNGKGGSHSPILMDKVPSHTHAFTTGAGSAHHHTVYRDQEINSGAGTTIRASATSGSANTTTGDESAHTHTGTTNANGSASNWTPLYVDMILATRN